MFKNFWSGFERVLFKPISTNAICIFRIGLGLCSVAAALIRFPDFLMWYGTDGVMPLSVLRRYESTLSIWNFIKLTDINSEIVLAVFLVASTFLTIGLFTRISTFLVYFLYTSLRLRNTLFWISIDTTIHLFVPVMLFAPAGEKFSVDQLIRKKLNSNYQEKLYSPFAQRILQFAIATIYFRGFICKLLAPDWTDGSTALNNSLHSEWVKHALPQFLETKWFYLAGTLATFAIEFSLFTLIWFKKTRYWTLAVGVFFHLMLNYFLNIDFLEYAMIASYILFIYPDDLERFLVKKLHMSPSPHQ